jgi:predicted RNA-binding Zn-ribbon protein involved in translation (DUF1610 family)
VSSEPVLCPKCGTEMNHQADKLVEPVTRAEAKGAQAVVLGGVIVAVFACPACGWIDSRREADEAPG